MKKVQTFLMGLATEPRFKEAIHRKMRKLATKLEFLASVYFGEDIVIMYIKRPQKMEAK